MELKYIRDQDTQEYRKFCIHHIPSFARAPTEEIWHYTNADGLIGILKAGKVWSTQITCLNDNLEQRYFGSIVHTALSALLPQITDPRLSLMFRIAEEALSKADFAAEGRFVTCFSEIEDDLNQWRGYGGGECGYAIGFRHDSLLKACTAGGRAMLLPMNYEKNRHDFLVNEVLRMAQIYFMQGIVERGISKIELWAREFLFTYARELDIFSSTFKHPKFEGEKERRIVTSLQADDIKNLIFRQKRTLLARHLPIDLTAYAGVDKLLPITRIYVGPGPAQRVSQVSVGDLLLQSGYKDIKVEISQVPYRVP